MNGEFETLVVDTRARLLATDSRVEAIRAEARADRETLTAVVGNLREAMSELQRQLCEMNTTVNRIDQTLSAPRRRKWWWPWAPK